MKGDVVNLIAVPFLIGSVPFALSVIIGNRFLKSYRESNKFVFWGGITASAFAGWTVSNMIMARYTESELFGAESFNAESFSADVWFDECSMGTSCPTCYGQGSPYGCGGDYCGWCGTDWKQPCDAECPADEIVGWDVFDYGAESFSADGKRPQGVTSTRMRHKETGEIATQIPLSEIRLWEKLDAESFSADSKFKEPYMKGGKLDMKRGNDGKFRRRLVVPLEKNQ